MHLLWKRESNNSELYVEVFKIVSTINRQKCYNRLAAGKQSCPKSNHRSRKHRKIADSKLEQKKWIEAMDQYTASLCYAEKDSENMSWAYGKRSVCFLNIKMYEKCLIDIDLATRANCPPHLIQELEKRRNYCQKLMKNDDQFKKFLPKLSYEANERYPDMANVMGIRYNKEFGRHIRANCYIPVGKTIFLEEAFIAQTPESSSSMAFKCSNCLKSYMNFIPCANCNFGMFCNTNCAETDILHKTECTERFPEDPVERFVMRSIFFAIRLFVDIDSLIAFVEETVGEKQISIPHSLLDAISKYRAFLRLNRFLLLENKYIVSRRAFQVYSALVPRKSIKELFPDEKKRRFLMHLVLHHDNIISSNIYSAESKEDMLMNVTLSYFNHSCVPNAMMHRIGNMQYCVTIRPIKKNQQIFLTYMAESFVQSLFEGVADEKTNRYLLETFNFQCKCEMCDPDEQNSRGLCSNSDYLFVIPFASRLTLAYESKRLKNALYKKSANLLNEFGERWCDELAIITCVFIASGHGLFYDQFDGKFDELNESFIERWWKILNKFLSYLHIAYIFLLAYILISVQLSINALCTFN